MLSNTAPFPYSKKVLESKKSVFNFVTCDNDLEYRFAKFLDGAEDVEAFAKMPEQFGFSIEYPDSLSNIRNYYPDFVARMKDGTHWIIETKGREDIEVKRKDDAAERWCENATNLTGTNWHYVKVPQREFDGLQPSKFEDLRNVLKLL
jgi:type III restriction enzyme